MDTELPVYGKKEEVTRQLEIDGVDNPVDVIEAFEIMMGIIEYAVITDDNELLKKVIDHWNS